MSGTALAEEIVAEQRRLVALHDYDVLDSAPESDFDDIAALAARLCGTPAAAVSLVAAERLWHKARIGVDQREIGREDSFSAYAIQRDEVLQVPDARLDSRFRDHPLVTGEPHVRFYAGAPVITPGGYAVGCLGVVDHRARRLGPAQSDGLRALARHVMCQLELRRYARGLDAASERLRDAEIVRQRIRGRQDRLLRLVDDLLRTGGGAPAISRGPVDLSDLAHAAASRNAVLAFGRGLSVRADAPEPVPVAGDEPRLAQALERLVLNAIKYTPKGEITVRAHARGREAVLEVRDTGVGMSRPERARVLAPSRRAGAGLGLSVVRAIVAGHGGTVAVDSEPGRGTTVTVRLLAENR